ncbi:hypothetical protein ACSSS7_007984 [Eimeria intestinalis]
MLQGIASSRLSTISLTITQITNSSSNCCSNINTTSNCSSSNCCSIINTTSNCSSSNCCSNINTTSNCSNTTINTSSSRGQVQHLLQQQQQQQQQHQRLVKHCLGCTCM